MIQVENVSSVAVQTHLNKITKSSAILTDRLLARWQLWPAMRAFFYCLDADLQLSQTDSEPFLSEIVADVVYEELQDQVSRGYLKL